MTFLRRGDAVRMEIRTWAMRSGEARVEAGPVTTIVDPEAGAIQTLLPGGQMMTMPLPDGSLDGPAWTQGEGLEWFVELREFQGLATPIDQIRSIDGEEVQGFHLTLDGLDLTLWATRDNDRPVLLEGTLPGGLAIESRLWFDEPIDPSLFSI